jgi:predicted DNA-binding transcriptional regulator AlpA
MTGTIDRWLQLTELAQMFGLSEESLKRFAKNHGFPLRRLTPYSTPGMLESELVEWLKAQPMVGRPIRAKGARKTQGARKTRRSH